MEEVRWDIRREPRAWSGDEINARGALTPEHFEIIDGKLFFEDEQRLDLLAMLLENVGLDAAIRLAPVELWREADVVRAEPFDAVELHLGALWLPVAPPSRRP